MLSVAASVQNTYWEARHCKYAEWTDQFSWYFWPWFSQFLACSLLAYPLHACQWLSNVYQLQSRVCTPGIPVSSSPLLLLCPSHASHTVVHQCREQVTWPKCSHPTLTLTCTKVTVYLYSALGVSAIMRYINQRFTCLPPDLLTDLLTYHCPAAAAWPWVAGEILGGRHLVNTGVLSLKLQYTEVELDQAWLRHRDNLLLTASGCVFTSVLWRCSLATVGKSVPLFTLCLLFILERICRES